jgi:hypothetical protein
MSDEIKKTGRGGNHGSPTVGNNGLSIQKGDISSYIHSMTTLRRLPPVITDVELIERCELYFDWCITNDMRPGVEGLALACGINRRTLWDWESCRTHGNTRRSEIIKFAKQQISALTEQMALKGQLNPITYIFTMKNHFAYTDKTEIEIATNSPLGAQLTPEEIDVRIPHDLRMDDKWSKNEGLTTEEISKQLPHDFDV